MSIFDVRLLIILHIYVACGKQDLTSDKFKRDYINREELPIEAHSKLLHQSEQQIVIQTNETISICRRGLNSLNAEITSKRWSCDTAILLISKEDADALNNYVNKPTNIHRNRREVAENDGSISISSNDQEFSVIKIGGVSWVCEKLSELQCKPLWPQVEEEKEEATTLSPSGFRQDRQSTAFENDASDFIDQISAIVGDDERWNLGEREGGTSRSVGGEQNRRSGVITENDLNFISSENGTKQVVYNINGITWLCKQFSQLQCYPIFSPWDNPQDGSQPGAVTIRNEDDLKYEDQGYPDYPGSFPDIIKPTDFIYENTRIESGQGFQNDQPVEERTSFCSRTVKFTAKDEVLLRFATYNGIRRLYIMAQRRGENIVLIGRMLLPAEQGLGQEENNPPVLMTTVVNCDYIEIRVDGKTYQITYDFGREGVQDLEVAGNLEATGMVPRKQKAKPLDQLQPRGFNHMEKDSVEVIAFQPTDYDYPPGLSTPRATTPSSRTTPSSSTGYTQPDASGTSSGAAGADQASDGNKDDDESSHGCSSLAEDNIQVEGSGEVVISLDEGGNNTHKYRLSQGDDGVINVDIIGSQDVSHTERPVRIENKEYNYTLVITGTTIQIIHHDTSRNLTYNHGIQGSNITGIDIAGTVYTNSIFFKEEDKVNRTEGSALPWIQDPSQSVRLDIYGNICQSECSKSGNDFYCELADGSRNRCSPSPGLTSSNKTCTSECRKRNDNYFWCHVVNDDWDYCSAPLFFPAPPCHPDSETLLAPDPTDCSRYLSCEKGQVRLEECPDELLYHQANRTCLWPELTRCHIDKNGQRHLYGDFYSSLGQGSATSSSSAPETDISAATTPAVSLHPEGRTLPPAIVNYNVDEDGNSVVVDGTDAAGSTTATAAGSTTDFAAGSTTASAAGSTTATASGSTTATAVGSTTATAAGSTTATAAGSTTTMKAGAVTDAEPVATVATTTTTEPALNVDDLLALLTEEPSTSRNEIEGAAGSAETIAPWKTTSKSDDSTTLISTAVETGEGVTTKVPDVLVNSIDEDSLDTTTRVTSNTASTEPVSSSVGSAGFFTTPPGAETDDKIQQDIVSTVKDIVLDVWSTINSTTSGTMTSTQAWVEVETTTTSGGGGVVGRFGGADIAAETESASEVEVPPTTTPQSSVSNSAGSDLAVIGSNSDRTTSTVGPIENISAESESVSDMEVTQSTPLSSILNPAGSDSGETGSNFVPDQTTTSSVDPDLGLGIGSASESDFRTTTTTYDSTTFVVGPRLTGGLVPQSGGSSTDPTSPGASSAASSNNNGQGSSTQSSTSTSRRPGSSSLRPSTRVPKARSTESPNAIPDGNDGSNIVEIADRFTGSLTSHGEVCQDTCEKRGYQYYWCNKKSSRLGQWWTSDFCSPSPFVTHYGETCESECEKRDEEYFWCWLKGGSWGYCSPTLVYSKGLCDRQRFQSSALYAVADKCDSYIACVGGSPVPRLCKTGTYFDYLVQSCTFKKAAKCVGDAIAS